MRIKGTEVHHRQVEIEVDPREMFAQLRTEILRHHGFECGTYIDRNGNAVFDEECHGSHSWTDTKYTAKNRPPMN